VGEKRKDFHGLRVGWVLGVYQCPGEAAPGEVGDREKRHEKDLWERPAAMEDVGQRVYRVSGRCGKVDYGSVEREKECVDS